MTSGHIAVIGGDLIVLETTDGPEPCGGYSHLELGRAAPFPIGSHRDELMMNRVLVDVMEPRKVTALMGQAGLAEVLPESGAAGLGFAPVGFPGGQAVKLTDHLPERFRTS